MKYASTYELPNGDELVVVVLPLEKVSGWTEGSVPFTYLVEDFVEQGWIRKSNGQLVPPDNSLTLADFQRAHDKFLNAAARQYRYDSIHTASLRAAFPGPWHDEGVAFATWMDTVNVLGYQILGDVQQGVRPMFNNVEEYVALLPPFVHP